MKSITLTLLLTFAVVLPASRAASQDPTLDTLVEVKALAEGYALAFQKLYQSNTITLVVRRDGKTFTLRDVRKVEAAEGVLIVSIGSLNDKYVFNPRDVLYLTDSSRVPPPES